MGSSFFCFVGSFIRVWFLNPKLVWGAHKHIAFVSVVVQEEESRNGFGQGNLRKRFGEDFGVLRELMGVWGGWDGMGWREAVVGR